MERKSYQHFRAGEDSWTTKLLLCHRCRRWLDHVHRMNEDQIPKGWPRDTPSKPSCCNMLQGRLQENPKISYIKSSSWKLLPDDCSSWRHVVQGGVMKSEEKWKEEERERVISDLYSTFQLRLSHLQNIFKKSDERKL